MASVFYETAGKDAFFYEDSNIVFPKHIHKQLEICYLIEGNIQAVLNGRKIILRAKDIFIVFPHLIHSYESIGKTKFYIGLIDVERLGVNKKIFLGMECENPVIPIDKVNSNVKICMQMLAAENQKGELSKYPEAVCGYFNVIIDYLLEQLQCRPIREGKNQELIKPILNYMVTHFQENITLEMVAREVGLSKYYLSKLFAQKIGYSFNDYLNLLRIDYGKELLSMTDHSVEDIAFFCGFQSESSFFRNFKKAEDFSPLQYRKNIEKIMEKNHQNRNEHTE